ncbi:putative transmembrane ascorbate ferrireductase 3 [Morus notabilis]|uniref:Putative transmembrane ascorbate ferrireductase 3 n=1 Tax=Morus notabilis TaxID=981085 RepID=W9RZS1_9ROSA|nr:probable transmembrane ascorbate ferrireductase 3 [Morus notabilis]EXC05044.1 putative transmembrane ascorbate ferrireductase 3 [Morus notabilis]
MDGSRFSYTYRRPAFGLTGFAHLFGILAIILMLVWLLHYRGNIDYDSENPDYVFNVHPVLMFVGYIFLSGQAMMAYKTVPAARGTRKFIHMLLHVIALIMGIVGICAVFKYHNMKNIEDMYSLHSWIGLGTFCLYVLQWLLGFVVFMLNGASADAKFSMLGWHMAGGRALLFMSICAALTGLMEKAHFLGLRHQTEARLVNFTGLSILLFGVFVDFTVVLGRCVYVKQYP